MRNAVALALAIAAWLAAAPADAGDRFVLSYGSGDGDSAARDAWRRRVQRARLDYEAFAASAVQVYLSFPNHAPQRTVARVTSIMRDPTLRVGDIYAAANGFMVFKGRIASAHAPADFAPIPAERARELSLAIGAAR